MIAIERNDERLVSDSWSALEDAALRSNYTLPHIEA
jgi:hypothetical protein